jgi:hypothetical protein
MAIYQDMEARSFLVKPWELAALWIETVIAGAAVLAAFLVGLPNLVDGVFVLPRYVWAGCGFFALIWAIVPLLNVYARSRRGRGLPLLAMLGSTIVGAIVGAALFALLS